MIFQVRLQTAAVQDLDAAYHYAASHAPAPAARWLGRFKAALKTLEHNPERCPLAPESLKSSRQLREFLFGKRPFVFRVIHCSENRSLRNQRSRIPGIDQPRLSANSNDFINEGFAGFVVPQVALLFRQKIERTIH